MSIFSFALPHWSRTDDSTFAWLHSFGIAIENAFNATTQKIQDFVTSPVGQGIIGFGLGICAHRICEPLTEKMIKALTIPTIDLDLACKILLTPFVCIVAPINEEILFRGVLQDTLTNTLESFYLNLGFSNSAAHLSARVTSLFFISVIFGLAHFLNAIVFDCNPILFLPQVVYACIVGVMFGLAKEFTGDLYMPIGMHMGGNIFTWAQFIRVSL